MKFKEGKKYFEFSLLSRIFLILLCCSPIPFLLYDYFSKNSLKNLFIYLVLSLSLFIFFLMFFSYFTFTEDSIVKTFVLFLKKEYKISDVQDAKFMAGSYGIKYLNVYVKSPNQRYPKGFNLQIENLELFHIFCEILIEKKQKEITDNLNYYYETGYFVRCSKDRAVIFTTEGIKEQYSDEIHRWSTIPCTIKKRNFITKYIFELNNPVTLKIDERYLMFSEQMFIEECAKKCIKDY